MDGCAVNNCNFYNFWCNTPPQHFHSKLNSISFWHFSTCRSSPHGHGRTTTPSEACTTRPAKSTTVGRRGRGSRRRQIIRNRKSFNGTTRSATDSSITWTPMVEGNRASGLEHSCQGLWLRRRRWDPQRTSRWPEVIPLTSVLLLRVRRFWCRIDWSQVWLRYKSLFVSSIKSTRFDSIGSSGCCLL